MKEFAIGEKDAGQRLDKCLQRILKEAPASFCYKMLRKKNITLNGSKALGKELLQKGDVIRLFLSDETFDKFAGKRETPASVCKDPQLSVVYEDTHVLIVNKPAGILSQKAKADDVSMNELCISYLIQNGSYDPSDPVSFTPSVCNRLDRNTSGLLLVGKTLAGSSMLSAILKDRSLHKYYACVVKGSITEPFVVKGYLKKDENANQVQILSEKEDGAYSVETNFKPLKHRDGLTLLEAELITGKTHQIRAHLSHIGHPIIGDPKYGDPDLNHRMHAKRQLLHAYRLKMPKLKEPFCNLSGKRFEIALPDDFPKFDGIQG